MTKRFNLSEWALSHQALVLFFMIVLAVIGVGSYLRLGQAEDPDFTFKLMVVRTIWPGASADEVERQLTDRIEKKLQETPRLDFLRSYSKPGESVVFVFVKDSARPDEIKDTWYQVRKKVGDIRGTLPQGVVGPFFNDEFGDTFGNIYALTGDGFTYAQLKETADRIRNQLLRVKDVAKVELIGEQDEKIYVELANAKLATFGIEPAVVFAALQQQNAVSATGSFETPTDRIYIRASGALDSVESVKQIAIRANGRLFRLGDIASVTRGFADPPQPRMRYMGRDALGVAVSMVPRGDIIALGKALDAETERIERELPVGLELDRVNDQPATVKRSVGEFTRSLAEAVAIVLVVSFVSLGLRTGLIVALSIPLTLFVTFLFMFYAGVDLHKISLGALIISLGLLVDDAIISVEMMVVKMEQGWERVRAASYAYSTTAMPMLTGTIVTAAGFLPIGLARSSTGEYTFSIFAVTTIALLVSWVVSVLFVPYLGYKLLPGLQEGRRRTCDEGAVYRKPFYRRFRGVVQWSVANRWIVIGATVAVFLLSVFAFRFVQQQFFPAASRPELIVDLRLPEGSSLLATEAQVKKLEAVLLSEPVLKDNIDNFVSYVGSGSPRFYLPFDQQLVNANFGQFIVNTKSNEAREMVRTRLLKLFEEDFPEVRGRVNRLENGPPVGFPVQFRVIGEDKQVIRGIAQRGREGHARQPLDARGQLRLGRALEGDPPHHRPEPRARAGHLHAGAGHVPEHGALGPAGHHVPRGRQAGRRGGARRARGARVHEPAQGPRRAGGRRAHGAAGADRRPLVRLRAGHLLAPRPPADDHRALRPEGRRAGAGREPAGQREGRRDPREAAVRLPHRHGRGRSRTPARARNRSRSWPR